MSVSLSLTSLFKLSLQFHQCLIKFLLLIENLIIRNFDAYIQSSVQLLAR
jgi:uncharacterized membrane protein